MLLAEVGAYLAAQSASVPFNTVLVRGTNLFEGDLPETPVIVVGLFEYPGPAPEHDLGTDNTRLEYARFQVQVRHTTFATGRLLAQQICNALVAIGGRETLSGVAYLTIDALQSNPTQLERSPNKYWRWSWSFQATKEVSTS